MQQILDPTAAPALPATPALTGTSGYFTEGSPGVEPATDVRAWFLNMIMMEMLNTLSAANVTPDTTGANFTQLVQAAKRIANSNVTTVNGNTTLTADQSGLVLVSAAAGNVTVILPASNSAGGRPLQCRFLRTDTSANTVSIAFAAGDSTLIGGSSTALSMRALSDLVMVADGNGHWVVMPPALPQWAVYTVNGGVQQVSINGGAFTSTGAGEFVVPAWGRFYARGWAAGGGGGSGSGSAGGSGGGGGGFFEGDWAQAPGTSLVITVGAPGAGGTASGNGSSGGSTSLGALASATGGGGGYGAASGASSSGTGGTGTGGMRNESGAIGGTSASIGGVYFGGQGGAAFCGSNALAVGSGSTSPAMPMPGNGGNGSGGTTAAGTAGTAGKLIIRF